MKVLAILLSAAISVPALGQSLPEQTISSSSAESIAPVVITAPHLSKEEIRQLKRTRTAGVITAGSGTGLLAYCVIALSFGPVGWATGLIFVGGLTAYLAHRKLKGEDTFPTNASADNSAAVKSPPSP